MDISTRTVSTTRSQWIRKTFAVILMAIGALSLVGFVATLPSDPSSAPSGAGIVLASLVGGVMLYRGPKKMSVTQAPAEDRSGRPPLPPPPPRKLPFNRLAVWSFILSLYPIATP